MHDRIDVGTVIHGGLTSYSSAAGKHTALGDTQVIDGLTYLVDRHDSQADLGAIDDNHLTDTFKKWKEAIGRANDYRAADASAGSINIGDVDIDLQIVGPRLEQPDGLDDPAFRSFGAKKYSINGHSVVARLVHDKVQVLFTGDVNHKAGKYLAGQADTVDRLDAHVLKAPHHGSHEFDLDFLKAVHPQISVVSSGEEPDYGHPRANFLGTIGKVSRGEPLLFSTELAATFKQTGVESDDAIVAALDLNDPGGLGTARRLWMKRLSGIINVRSDGEKLFAARRVTQSWQWNTYLMDAADRDP